MNLSSKPAIEISTTSMPNTFNLIASVLTIIACTAQLVLVGIRFRALQVSRKQEAA
jgi:hypothetical protein